MVKTGIVILGYLEAECLKRLFTNLTQEMKIPPKDILYIDGCVVDYTDPKMREDHLSYDGSITMAKDAGVNVELQKETMTWMEKLNSRYDLCKKYGFDAAVWLDADEYLTGDWYQFCEKVDLIYERLKGQPNVISIDFEDLEGLYDNRSSPKLFISPSEFETKYAHFIHYPKGSDKKLQTRGKVNEISVKHDDSIRPDWRERMHSKFQIRNGRNEKKRLQEFVNSKQHNQDGFTILKTG